MKATPRPGRAPSPLGHQLVAARDEVVVQMGFGGERDLQASASNPLQVRPRVAGGVDDQAPSVPQIQEVGGISQSLLDDGVNVARRHRLAPHGLRARIG